jgi:hypothetical protein
MMRVPLGSTLPLAILATACATHAFKKSVDHVSPKTRLEDIRKAQVWQATDVESMDLRAGPKGSGAFAPGQTVNCTHIEKALSGKSPKFDCVIPPEDEVKVKFGSDNGEVYAEVAATRLFWALGFPVDRMYPVRVVCAGCAEDGTASKDKSSAPIVFDPASIERKFKGRALETAPESGWSWSDLDLVDESAGGAPRAQRDALKLLAVFVQHSDNKAAQQRLVCIDEKAGEAGASCEHSVMMVNDLGQTFGRSNLFNRDAVGSVNLENWTKAPVWSTARSNAAACVGDLPPSQTGSLEYPRISEAGRRFLSDLLMRLSDAQLRDLFDVSRFTDRKEGSKRPATVEEWIDAFKTKRGEIAGRTCPS